MTGPRTVVIVGAGLAGAKAAETLRDDGYDGRITLFGAESARPYERPALSKTFLRGEGDPDEIYVHPADFAASHDIALRTNTRVTALDTTAHVVTTEEGERVPYDRLLLTTGSSPRRLGVPGADLDGIHVLRTVEDATALRDVLKPGTPVTVVGAGWIGSEVAASARQLGAEVTVVDPLSVPLEHVMGTEVGGVYRDLHLQHGVEFRPGTRVEGFLGDEHVRAVRTDQGDIETSVVVVGIGAEPRIDLARAAGLDIDGGVVVDERLRSSDPHVYAAGDIAAAWHPHFATRLRIEHWSNALNQGITAGHNLLGADQVYDRTPSFFSDQYDLGMEYRGHATHWDEVVLRGDPSDGAFCAFWITSGQVTAALNANIWDVGDALEALVRTPIAVDPRALADVDTPLDELMSGTDADLRNG